ncbi:MAG: nicotinamide-nucleotide amidohydrolase family protein [Clostridia bacterium]|nr:nicotinamide-nucleotide amidohydrolase family protein [Clostridia bacterium]
MEVVRTFRDKKCTLSFAESCTGGLAAATVVSVPGASDIFYGGIVSYDNSVKRKMLFVEQSVLESVGAVSEECAMQMACGAREQIGTDISVSVTGIAGPDGGTKEKPVGLVYIGVSSFRGTYAKKLLLGDAGDRTAIREASVCEMLKAALDEIMMI